MKSTTSLQLFILSIFLVAPLSAQPITMSGITFDQGQVYKLAAGESIFANQNFTWNQLPKTTATKLALRTELEIAEPVTVNVTSNGILYAVFWQWDFGFSQHLPKNTGGRIHGWQKLGMLGGGPGHRSGIKDSNWFSKSRLNPEVHNAPEPFAPLALYSRVLKEGTYKLNLTEYHGQWVIVGFQPGLGGCVQSPLPIAATFSSCKTSHNVCDPGQTITVSSEKIITAVKLYREGKLVSESKEATFTAPEVASRYVMKVEFQKPNPEEEYAPNPYADSYFPLTVGYKPIDKPGWPSDYFPIQFWDGWDYQGLFLPNYKRLADLIILNQFEMGANTYFVSPEGNPLLDALNVRVIVGLRGKTRFQTREVEDERFDPGSFLWEIDHVGPFKSNVMGFHVEDEPPTKISARLEKCQDVFEKAHPGRYLFYCLHGPHAPKFWPKAKATIRQTRAYPIRRTYRDNFLANIKSQLADYLIECQKVGTETPLWFVAQTFADLGRPGGMDRWELPTPEQFRLMMNLCLGRGVKGFSYFCFAGCPAIHEDLLAIVYHPYVPTGGLYNEVVKFNDVLTENAVFLNDLTWQQEVEQPNDKLDIQLLKNSRNQTVAYITAVDYENKIEAKVNLPKMKGERNVSLRPGGAVIINISTGEQLSLY